MKNMVIAALQVYKRWISPMLPAGSCRFVPTCSEYATDAVYRYGAVRGLAMAAWRFVRCNPFGGHGYDPVVRDSCYVEEQPQIRQDGADLGHQLKSCPTSK